MNYDASAIVLIVQECQPLTISQCLPKHDTSQMLSSLHVVYEVVQLLNDSAI